MCWNGDWRGLHAQVETEVLVLHGLLLISAVIMCEAEVCAADGF